MNWTRYCSDCNRENERTVPPPKSHTKLTRWGRMPCKHCGKESLNYGFDKDEPPRMVDEYEDEA